ncbi:MAG: TIR domain-containing protein [Methanobacterium sp.]|nr:TIR domain-containing protein [Methanobacterium sp.]
MDNEPITYKLFISQLKESTDEYNKLIDKLEALNNFPYTNYSIADKTTKEDLKEQIKPVDVVVILSGQYSINKDLIKREIDVAIELNKPIVMIRPYGLETVPESIEQKASEVIGWNAGCIIDSIQESLDENVDN